MTILVIINPNSSEATTESMVSVARDELAERPDVTVKGMTASCGPPMITDHESLEASANEVLRLAEQAHRAHGQSLAALIVGAFGDPGLLQIRESLPVPCTGLAEAAILDASQGGRRFGIATTTRGLEADMQARVVDLGVAGSFTGFRFTAGDPRLLVSDQAHLVRELTRVARQCSELDNAAAVIIAGGPLASSTRQVAAQVDVTLVNPVSSACNRVLAHPNTGSA